MLFRSYSDGLLFMLNFALFFNFRIILRLIRYVATISMKEFYDDETLLKIAFKTLLRFLAGINRLRYGVHAECSSR